MYTNEALNFPAISLIKEDEPKEFCNTAKTGIIYVDKAMKIRNINGEAEKICSLERSKTIGRRTDQVFRHSNAFLQFFQDAARNEYFTNNIRLTTGEQVKFIHADAVKLKNPSGDMTGMIVMVQDVSNVRSTLKQIQTTQLLMAMAELAAGVAHHVRTPLTTIGGYLQVMLNRLENDQYMVRRDVLEMLLGEVSYINNVVKELVLFAKPPVQLEPGVDVNRILEESLLLTFKQLGGENIEIDKELAAAIPHISADRNLLKQAMVNIMQNAVEAMPDAGRLGIRTWIHSDSNMMVVSVTDTGSGITPHILHKVFEPFYTTKLDRMGLGLPVAHRIIHEHRGFIHITSTGKGTKVLVYLPLVESQKRQLSTMYQQILNLQ